MTTLEKIRVLSKEKGYSLAMLEREAGLSSACISHWGQINPTARNLKKVATILGVTVDDLLDDD